MASVASPTCGRSDAHSTHDTKDYWLVCCYGKPHLAKRSDVVDYEFMGSWHIVCGACLYKVINRKAVQPVRNLLALSGAQSYPNEGQQQLIEMEHRHNGND